MALLLIRLPSPLSFSLDLFASHSRLFLSHRSFSLNPNPNPNPNPTRSFPRSAHCSQSGNTASSKVMLKDMEYSELEHEDVLQLVVKRTSLLNKELTSSLHSRFLRLSPESDHRELQNPSWVSTNLIFQRHPRLQFLLKCSSRRHLESFIAYAIISGLFRNPFVSSRILHSSTLFSQLNLAFTSSLFAQMNKPNTFSFNTMIRFAPSDALSLYVEMLRRGILPDKHTFPFLLKSLNSLSQDVKIGRLVHAHVLMFGFVVDPFVQNGLLSMYFACGVFGDALYLFDEMSQRDVVNWTMMISGFSDQDCHEQAVCVFNAMRSVPKDSNVKPNTATIVSVMSACAGLGSLDLISSLHAYIKKDGLEHDVYVQNSLIDSYAKCGSIAFSWQIFYHMSEKDIFSWTSMITGFAVHGFGKEALNVFSWMQQTCIVPDSTAFIAVLSACSHGGLVDEGIRVFELMEVYKLKPELKHYGCMVDLFSRAGLLTRAYELVSTMPMKPNLVILGALLSSCRVHGNLELAELVVKKIEEDCDYHGGAYVLLSNMYANQNQWQNVFYVREGNKGEGNKPQGQSWIEVKGVVHKFRVEDRTHPLVGEMKVVIDGLEKLMEGTLVDFR